MRARRTLPLASHRLGEGRVEGKRGQCHGDTMPPRTDPPSKVGPSSLRSGEVLHGEERLRAPLPCYLQRVRSISPKRKFLALTGSLSSLAISQIAVTYLS